MKSVVKANVRVANRVFLVGACAVLATACLEGDPIPADVVQRSEAVLLEGATGGAPVSPSGSTSGVPSGSVAPASSVAPAASVAPAGVAPAGVSPAASSSGFADNALPPVLPEADELGEELDEEAIPENAIPLDEFLRQ